MLEKIQVQHPTEAKKKKYVCLCAHARAITHSILGMGVFQGPVKLDLKKKRGRVIISWARKPNFSTKIIKFDCIS